MKRYLLSIFTLFLVVVASKAQDTVRKSEVMFDRTFGVVHRTKDRHAALDANVVKRPLRMTIRSWDLETHKGSPEMLPVSGFVVMNLRSGRLETIINGTTTRRAAEDFWTVSEGSTTQVRVLGQNAILETITVSRK